MPIQMQVDWTNGTFRHRGSQICSKCKVEKDYKEFPLRVDTYKEMERYAKIHHAYKIPNYSFRKECKTCRNQRVAKRRYDKKYDKPGV